MRYAALACDYDGTLAQDGRVAPEMLSRLGELARSGRKLVMVTGRILADLRDVFPEADLFDRIVAENGALLYNPRDKQETQLAEPPPDGFITELERRGVSPLAVGRVIVATREPNETLVLETIRDLGLELHVIFNKGAVMVLPAEVTKASGLAAALRDLKLSAHNVVGIGDAENDHAFLDLCECSVAVANALPALKERADLVTTADHGSGVIELIDRLIADDLAGAPNTRRHVPLAMDGPDREVLVEPYGTNILVAGTSGGGKSTATTGFLERLTAQKYQVCIIDPEGDYETFEPALMLGTSERAPSVEQVLEVLEDPGASCAAKLLGLPLHDRPEYFAALLTRVQDLRARTGRPHWLVVDEAHHVLPAEWEPAAATLPRVLESTILITVHPELLSKPALGVVDDLIAVGDTAQDVLASFAKGIGEPVPTVSAERLSTGEVYYWNRRAKAEPIIVQVIPPTGARTRHKRKYAEGDVGEDRSFYFRGPEEKLNLRANNLALFIQLAEGVDEETWLHHLRRGDYTTWFREVIKDPGLAEAAQLVEKDRALTAEQSRERIAAEIQERYTLPA